MLISIAVGAQSIEMSLDTVDGVVADAIKKNLLMKLRSLRVVLFL